MIPGSRLAHLPRAREEQQVTRRGVDGSSSYIQSRNNRSECERGSPPATLRVRLNEGHCLFRPITRPAVCSQDSAYMGSLVVAEQTREFQEERPTPLVLDATFF